MLIAAGLVVLEPCQLDNLVDFHCAIQIILRHPIVAPFSKAGHRDIDYGSFKGISDRRRR
jgi:hypothetical protein